MTSAIPKLPPSNVVTMESNAAVVRGRGMEEPIAPAFTFNDMLDVVNPLQHIPVVSTLYQKFTGDTIDTGPRLLGGALFGVMTGSFLPSLVAAAFNAVVKEGSGKDPGEHVAALFETTPGAGEPTQVVSPTVPAPQAVVAENDVPTPTPANSYHLFANAPTSAPPSPTRQEDDATTWDAENIQLAIDRYQLGHKAPALRRPNIQVQG